MWLACFLGQRNALPPTTTTWIEVGVETSVLWMLLGMLCNVVDGGYNLPTRATTLEHSVAEDVLAFSPKPCDSLKGAPAWLGPASRMLLRSLAAPPWYEFIEILLVDV